jgi:hypothetical protein
VGSVVSAVAVGEWLGESEEYTAWVAGLAGNKSPRPVKLPQGDELRALLDRMGVLPDDAEDLVASVPSPERDPELWWLLERTRDKLTGSMGLGRGDLWGPSMPHLPERLGTKGRFFYAYVMLAAVPDALAYFAERGIPDEIGWATLADFGRQIAIYRRIHGRGGLDVQFWFALHFRGNIYDFGRLQLNRQQIQSDDQAKAGAPYGQGDYVLGVHIPESGPMTPEACDESFRRAKEFYARYFPEEPYRYANCTSWLLDDQFAEYLPEDSNIVRFQRRFKLIEGDHEGDKAVFQFVFRKLDPVIDELPQRTTLERAIVRHLKDGRHWKVRTGWLEL